MWQIVGGGLFVLVAGRDKMRFEPSLASIRGERMRRSGHANEYP
jgi:hypothetical protein